MRTNDRIYLYVVVMSVSLILTIMVASRLANKPNEEGSMHYVDCMYDYGAVRSEVWMLDSADKEEEGRKYCESQKVVEVQDGL